MNKNKKLIWMATMIDEKTAKEFDRIADRNLRNRARQMEYIIRREVENVSCKDK